MTILFAVVNVVVTGLFVGVVLSQYLGRHRIYQLYWSMALAMAFIGTLAYVLMIAVGSTTSGGEALFRTYYIFGAALTAAWLGLGSIALISSNRITRICVAIVSVLSIVAVVSIAMASIDTHQLAQVAGTAGKGVLQTGVWLVMIIILNTFGAVAVVGVAIYSGWKLIRRQSANLYTSKFLWANVLIVVGVSLISYAGGGARVFGLEGSFWLIMAVGWLVLFVGVLLASRRAAVARTVGQVQASEVKGGAASV